MSSSQPSAGQSRRVGAVDRPVQDQSSDAGLPAVTRKYKRSAKTTKARKSPKPKKPTKVPLSERLPEGAYDNRPREKKYFLQWLYFWAWAMLGLYTITSLPVPKPSVREMIERHRVGLQQDAEETQLKTVTVNQKGGTGKTPVATAVAATIARVTQQFTLLVDANQTKGNTASRIGVKHTMSIREAVVLFEEQFEKIAITHEWAIRVFRRHPAPGYGSLRVITSDDHNQRKTRLGYSRVLSFFRGIKSAVAHMVFDCGNTTDGAATRAAVEFADVPMFVARLSLENSLTDLLDTINHYRDTAPDKVENAMIVIVDHRRYRLRRSRNTSEQDYARFFNKDCENEFLRFSAEQVVLIPHDSFYPVKQLKAVEDPDDLIKVIVLEKLSLKTVEAYLRLVRQLFAMQRRVDAKRSIAGDQPAVEYDRKNEDDAADLLDPTDQPEAVTTLEIPDDPSAFKRLISHQSSSRSNGTTVVVSP